MLQEEKVIDNISKFLFDNGFKKNVLTKATGLKAYIITAILNKRRKLSVLEYVDICNYFKLPLDYFLLHKKEDAANPTTNHSVSTTKYD